jgi:hypothetical protein
MKTTWEERGDVWSKAALRVRGEERTKRGRGCVANQMDDMTAVRVPVAPLALFSSLLLTFTDGLRAPPP